MRIWSYLSLGLILALSACASDADQANQGDTEKTATESALAMGPSETEMNRERTERRLLLERSVDQWWLAFERQEYGKADGIANALEELVDKNFDSVLSDLKAASPRFRKLAAVAIGFSHQPKVVPSLVEALRDPFSEVVFGSLLSLWRLALADITVPADPIIPYLNHSDSGIRSNAAMVLAHATKKGNGNLFLPLTAAMEDSEPKVRLHAAAALGALGDNGAVPFLVKGLADEMPLVRIRSAYALGRIGDRRATYELIRRIDDPSTDVSKAVHKSLVRITGQNLPREKEAWQSYWRREKAK